MIAVDPSFIQNPRPALSAVPQAPRVREDRYKSLCEELDAVKERAFSRVGAEDVRYVRRLEFLSRAMEIVGRGLIHFSPEPVSFLRGVTVLWLHKQLQATEIGHSALHGAYDRLPGGEAFASKTFHWDTPIDEESWRHAHNVRHHGNTNIVGRDPDVNFGPVRLTDKTPWSSRHRWQLPFALLSIFPFFGFVINLHVTGLSELYTGDGRALDILPDRSPESIQKAWTKALRKYAPYYLYNFVRVRGKPRPHRQRDRGGPAGPLLGRHHLLRPRRSRRG
jgi:linoleoyl-CoA desaturase